MELFKKKIEEDPEKKIKKYCLFDIPLFKKEYFKDVKKYKIGNLSIFKVKQTEQNKKYYFLGVQCVLLRKKAKGIEGFKKVNLIEYADSDIPQELIFNKYENPLVSIIIPSYNQISYTKKCLYSILMSDEKIEYEIIIADDCSTDETSKIEEFIKNIVVSRNNINVGYIKNCNHAAKLARGKFLYFLNNDTQVQKNWLSELIMVFEKNENVGVVGSKIFDPDGAIQECGVYVFKDCFHVSNENQPQSQEYYYLKECDYVSGCSFMTSKSLFERIGGFDEIYSPLYYGDADYCFHVKTLNYKVFVQPRSCILHYGGISYSKNNTAFEIKNNNIFREKWKHILDKKTTYSLKKLPFTDKVRPRTILVVDDFFPQYDKHAGGKSTFNIIMMFIKMGLSVKFCPIFSDRIEEPYSSVLSDHGVEVILGNNINQWIDDNYFFLDYMFLSRPNVAMQFMIKSLRAHGIKVFYYGQDFHALRMLRESSFNNVYKSTDIDRMKNLELKIIEFSDVSYYPSNYEVDLIKTYLPQCNVKKIPVLLYDPENMEKLNKSQQPKNIIFVGSAHGPNLDALKWFLTEIFPYVTKKIPGIVLNIVSSGVDKKIRSFKSENIIIHSRITDEELSELYMASRLSIAPLRYGAGIKGKIIDAIFHMTPVITTTIGAEGITIDPHIIRVADDAKSFADILIAMYLDKNLYVNVAKKCRNFIEKDFTFSKAESTFMQDIDNSYYINEERF